MIRRMTNKDLPSVKTLMQSIPRFWHRGWTDETLDGAFRASGDLALVYVADGEVVGFIFGYDLGFRAYLGEFAVAQNMRGCGIGKSLLGRLERVLRERGCELIISDVWKSAEPFYTKLGWGRPDVVLLRKRLAEK